MKDAQLDTTRQVQDILSNVRNDQRNFNEVDKRIDALEMHMNKSLLSGIQKNEQDLNALSEKSNQREVSLL